MNNEKNLTQGNILYSLLGFALPVLLALFLQSLYGGADLLIVGHFSDTADVSGVATGSMLMQTITMVITGLSVGITVLVARKTGEGKNSDAGRTIGSGICLFGVFAVILTIVLGFFSDIAAQILHAPPEAFSSTSSYIKVCGLGCIFIIAYNLLGAVFRGLGDSRTPLITVCIACFLNIAGDLIFAGLLNLGAFGAALATVISQGVSVFISLVIISRRPLSFEMKKEYVRFDSEIIRSELKLGIPIGLQEMLVGMSFLLIQTIINSINVTASAGVGVAEKVCGFIMLVPSSYMQSMAAFVAQNKGAGKHDRAVRALLCGIGTSLIVGVIMASFTFFHGDILAHIFSKDTQVIQAAHEYLKAYAIDTISTSILFCMIGYFNGCGNTVFVMLQGIVGAIGVRVPAAFVFSRLRHTTLFLIGLSTPVATVVQITMCVIFYMYMKKKTSLQSVKIN
ncbi:MAG: MATE family efflux transporter [Oscillospiraceae bacterium]|nr:MATE family efflux transporter [Oscillospiraceae bacterium]